MTGSIMIMSMLQQLQHVVLMVIYSMPVFPEMLRHISSFARMLFPNVFWALCSYRDAEGNTIQPKVTHACLAKRILSNELVREQVRQEAMSYVHTDFKRAATREEFIRMMSSDDANQPHIHGRIEENLSRARHYIRLIGGTGPNGVAIRIWCYCLRTFSSLIHVMGIKGNGHVDASAGITDPVVYLLLNRSSLDYLLLAYYCFDAGMPIPRFIMRGSSTKPWKKWLLTLIGGLFIEQKNKRLANDPIYLAVVEAYIVEHVKAGINIQSFLEDHRTRTGKVSRPKTWLMKVLQGAIERGELSDAVLQPVSIGYDRILTNDETIMADFSGNRKRNYYKESLGLRVLNVIRWMMETDEHVCYGKTHINFGKSFRMCDAMVDMQQKIRAREARFQMQSITVKSSSIENVHEDDGGDSGINSGEDSPQNSTPTRRSATREESAKELVPATKFGIVHDVMRIPDIVANGGDEHLGSIPFGIACRCVHSALMVQSVNVVPLIASVLLSYYQRGISTDQLAREITDMKGLVIMRGGRVQDYDEYHLMSIISSMISARNDKVETNNLIKTFDEGGEILLIDNYTPRERMELSLYRNQLIHHFICEALASCALYGLEHSSQATSDGKVPRSVLLQSTCFLATLLKHEFVFKPYVGWSGLVELMEETIDLLVGYELLSEERIEDSDDTMMRVNNGVQHLDLCNLLWHFIDAYWLTTICLFSICNDRSPAVKESAFMKRVRQIGERFYFCGHLDLFEALTEDAARNSVTVLEMLGIIEFICTDDLHQKFGSRLLRLTDRYQDEDTLKTFTQEIHRYRKKLRSEGRRRYNVRSKEAQVQQCIKIVKEYVR